MSHFSQSSRNFLRLCTLLIAGVAHANGGDVDGDRALTVLDIQRTVNGILEGRPPTEGDVDRDGAVDVRDVQRAANGILQGSPLLFDVPEAAAAGDIIELEGQGLSDAEITVAGEPAQVIAREGDGRVAIRVPAGASGDQPVRVNDGPAFPLRILCAECESPFAHQIRWPKQGMPVAGPTQLVLETPDFGRENARPVEAWLELDGLPVPVPLSPLNGGGARTATRYLMQLPEVYQMATLVVVVADEQGRVDLLQRELEVFPPSFLPEHAPLPGQVGVRVQVPPQVEGAQIVAVPLDGGAPIENFYQADTPFGAWLGLPPGDYLLYAEAEVPDGILSTSGTARVEYDSASQIMLDLQAVEPLPIDPGAPRVVGIASRPLTRRAGHPVTLVAVTNQSLEDTEYEWTVNGLTTVAGASLPVLLENDLFVQLQPLFDAPSLSVELPLLVLPGRADRDAVAAAPEAPNTDYEGFPCGQVYDVMERVEFASEQAAANFSVWAESIEERADCGAFIGWAEADALQDLQPGAWLDGELAITQLCVADPICGGCTDFSAEAPRQGVGYTNTCGVLSVAHSLVYKLGVVEEDDAMVDSNGDGTRDKWKRSFLSRLRRESDHDPDTGTTVSGEQDAYEDIDDGEDFDIQCGGEQQQDDYDWDGGTIDPDELKAWCEGLDTQADEDDEDCTFIIRGQTSGTHADGSGNYAGHAMHIKSVAWDEAAGKCTITTVNTGRQGNGSGDDVNVNPGEQSWEVTGSGTSLLNVLIQPGSSGYSFWRNNFVWTQARSYCCRLDD